MNATFHRYELEGWGHGELWIRAGLVVAHDLVTVEGAVTVEGTASPSGVEAHTPKGAARPPELTVSRQLERERADFVSDLCNRVRTHLAGVPTAYDDVLLDVDGLTALQIEMTRALRKVPWGEVVTYGELAALAGRRGAARAAGAYCAEGRWSLIVPFHRVVAADGIGGYGPSGTRLKRELLSMEGVEL